MLVIRVFTKDAWAKIAANQDQTIGVKLKERGDDVFVLSIAGSNPYKTGTPAATLFDQMMLAVIKPSAGSAARHPALTPPAAPACPAPDASHMLPDLSRDEISRYARHLILPDVGVEGQKRLKASRVLLVGAGGLGSPLALYLAAAGVGHIGLVDFDVVDVTNLQRQILHGTRDIGRPKVDSARERIADLNPLVELTTHETALTSQNALDIIGQYDIVVDGTDNFPTRYLVNDACVMLGKPNVYGSIFRFEGQASVFSTQDGPCYRCLFPEPPPPGMVPSCAEGGVLGVLPGLIGMIQATEAIKLILGIGEPLDRAAAARRRARRAVPHRQDPQESRVPRVRHARDHGADRLRRVLRNEDGRRKTERR